MSQVKEIMLEHGFCNECDTEYLVVLVGRWIEVKAQMGMSHGARRTYEYLGSVCPKCGKEYPPHQPTFAVYIPDRG